jgi:hypothetical protein
MKKLVNILIKTSFLKSTTRSKEIKHEEYSGMNFVVMKQYHIYLK